MNMLGTSNCECGLHSSTYRWLKWSVLCCVQFVTINKKKIKELVSTVTPFKAKQRERGFFDGALFFLVALFLLTNKSIFEFKYTTYFSHT